MAAGLVGVNEGTLDSLATAITSLEVAWVGEVEAGRTIANTTGEDFREPKAPTRNWTAPPIQGVASCTFNVGAFKRLLKEHPVARFRDWVLEGMREGFDNGSTVEEELIEQQPHQSAREDPEAVRGWLRDEEQRGHVQSFVRRPHPFTRACPVGLVPKGKKKRFISDLSAGERSVNEAVDGDEYSIRMIRFQDVVDIAAEFGPECHATFVDVRSAYRNVPLHPACWHLQVYLFDNLWWVDKRISFGSTSSAFIFDRVAAAINWIAQRAIDEAVGVGNCRLVHYLDDFALIARTKGLCEVASSALFAIFKELGVPLSTDKTKTNVQEAEYLGMYLNIREQVVSLPTDKRQKLAVRLDSIIALAASRPEEAAAAATGGDSSPKRRKPYRGWHGRGPAGLGSLRKKPAEELVGQLTWAHVVMPHHRTYIQPFLAHVMRLQTRASTRRLQRAQFTAPVTPELLTAARVWRAALQSAPPRPFATRPSVLHSHGLWVGREAERPRWVKVPATSGSGATAATTKPKWTCVGMPEGTTWNWWGHCAGEAWAVGDAAGEIGLGYFNNIRAVHRAWTAEERASFTLGAETDSKNSSTLQELKCLAAAAEGWMETGPRHGSVFNFFTDAQNVAAVLAKGRSNKPPVNQELRRLHGLCEARALHIRVIWHPRDSWAGVLADLLSRGDIQGFEKASAARGSRRGSVHPCRP
jgi:hypothetical protein